MYRSFFYSSGIIFSSISIFSILISCFFIPIFSSSSNTSISSSDTQLSLTLSSSGYVWPVPGYTKISSKFGPRKSPTVGASSYHKGIDVAAPTGTNLVAITDGIITFAGFSGSGGFTITYKCNNLKIPYCHVSPNLLVSVGDNIRAGQIIATVGPKNVYGVLNNPYKDKNGKPTNGAITGSHLHLSIKKDDKHIDPLSLLSI